MPKLSLNIERECKICGSVFRAKTLDSLYCSEKCGKVAYKRRRDATIVAERIKKLAAQGTDLNLFITVSEASNLYNIPSATLYRLMRNGKVPGIKVGTRTVRINRLELEKVLNPVEATPKVRLYNMEPDHCYTIGEICKKYKLDDSTVWMHIRKYSIPTRQIGNYVYAPKIDIDNLYR